MMLVMSAATVQSGKRNWRPWKVLLGVFVALVISFFGYQWFRASQDELRRNAAIEATDQIDPQWRLADLIREYETLPVSECFTQAATWRGYLGWFGDDIGERPGRIPFDRMGIDFAVRFPMPYFKILRERLQATELASPKSMRDSLEQIAKEPAISRVPFDDNNLMQRIRYVSLYLLDEIELAAHEGSYVALIPLIKSQLKLSAYCLATPKPINHLIGIAIRAQAISGIKRVLSLGTPTSEVLMQFQQILNEADQSHVNHILRCMRADYFDEMEKAGRDPAAWQRIKDELKISPLPTSPTIMERINYCLKWLEVESAMKSLPLAQAEVLEVGNLMIAQAKAQPADFLHIDLTALPQYSPKILRPVKHLLARQFVNSSFKVASAEASSLAELRSLIVGLACERYRLATGAWPKSLDELQPAYLKELPLDPYTNKPMLFRNLPDGVVIYSVGINNVDDGGAVLTIGGSPKDRGVKLFNPPLRGKKYEEVYPDRARPE